MDMNCYELYKQRCNDSIEYIPQNDVPEINIIPALPGREIPDTSQIKRIGNIDSTDRDGHVWRRREEITDRLPPSN